MADEWPSFSVSESEAFGRQAQQDGKRNARVSVAGADDAYMSPRELRQVFGYGRLREVRRVRGKTVTR